jgi:hypothetical protein
MFENGTIPRDICRPMREQLIGRWPQLQIRSIIICFHSQILLRLWYKDKMSWACSRHDTRHTYRGLIGIREGKKPSVRPKCWWNNINWIVKKRDSKAWSGFIQLVIGMWTWHWTFGFHKAQETCSKERLWSTKLNFKIKFHFERFEKETGREKKTFSEWISDGCFQFLILRYLQLQTSHGVTAFVS